MVYSPHEFYYCKIFFKNSTLDVRRGFISIRNLARVESITSTTSHYADYSVDVYNGERELLTTLYITKNNALIDMIKPGEIDEFMEHTPVPPSTL